MKTNGRSDRKDQRIIHGLLVLLALGCDKNLGPARAEARAVPSTVVAEYEGRRITLAEVDALLGDDLFRMRLEGLKSIVSRDLLPREAKRRGLTQEQLLEQEVSAKVTVPSEDELRARYTQAERAGEVKPGGSYEHFRDQLLKTVKYHNTAERRDDYMRELMRAARTWTDVDALGLRRLKPRSGEDAPARGGSRPAITIVEFTDFASPHGAQGNEAIREILDKYGDQVRIVFRQNPKRGDQAAADAARAALCAHEQQRYWDYRQLLFGNQSRLTTDALLEHAAKLGLHAEPFASCLRSEGVSAAVAKDVAEATDLLLDGSPEFLVNGIRLSGAHQFKTFAKIIETEKARIERL